jgi:hypothetical protein
VFVVYEGPVARTEKMTETERNRTDCNRTAGCGCPLREEVAVAVAMYFQNIKNRSKTGCSRLQPVFSIYTLYLPIYVCTI